MNTDTLVLLVIFLENFLLFLDDMMKNVHNFQIAEDQSQIVA